MSVLYVYIAPSHASPGFPNVGFTIREIVFNLFCKGLHCPKGSILQSGATSKSCFVTVGPGSDFHQLWLVFQLWHPLGSDSLLTVSNALVKLSIDFYNTLYVGLPLKTVWKLQSRNSIIDLAGLHMLLSGNLMQDL
ncbi:Hypothetical predicted protein [Podarcis lilfordi]|uniref:Uncharacterized protein n=1 Tax=Podarcis lilfordi TaxID=74358 RepID=A0AA35KME2_9SAUR|nr:Hypothetical predicted protein [Podarcis lilfordi]